VVAVPLEAEEVAWAVSVAAAVAAIVGSVVAVSSGAAAVSVDITVGTSVAPVTGITAVSVGGALVEVPQADKANTKIDIAATIRILGIFISFQKQTRLSGCSYRFTTN
jgi:hypothetical protein